MIRLGELAEQQENIERERLTTVRKLRELKAALSVIGEPLGVSASASFQWFSKHIVVEGTAVARDPSGADQNYG